MTYIIGRVSYLFNTNGPWHRFVYIERKLIIRRVPAVIILLQKLHVIKLYDIPTVCQHA